MGVRMMIDKNQRRFQRILEHAYNEVPFYNNVINSFINETNELSQDLIDHLPPFNKQTIKNMGWENFVSMRYLNKDNKLKDELTNAHLERTSGTSGTPMDILWNNDDYFCSSMNHWKYRSKYFGITPESRMCTSAKTIPGNGLFFTNKARNKLTFSTKDLNYETVPQIVKKINEYQPQWLYLQNSILYTLLWFCEQLNIKLPNSIKYIEYMGEPICGYYRKEIERILPVVTSNMYGCVETNGISYECSEGHNHLITDNVIVEIVDLDGNKMTSGETGFVCVTGLHNTAMPIIRYRLNDVASIDTEFVCACGNPEPVIEIKAARMPEYLILDDPLVYEDAALFCPINSGIKVFNIQDNDIVFNLKMNTLDNYELWVFRGNHNDVNVEELFSQIFKAYGLPNIKFTVHFMEAIDESKPAGILRIRRKL